MRSTWALAFAQFSAAQTDRFTAGFAAVVGGTGFAAGGWRTGERFAAAAAAAARFDDKHPSDPRGPDLRGRVAVEQEHWADAVPHLRLAVERNPDDAELLRLLARCHRRTGDSSAAARCEKRAADLERTPKPQAR